MSQIDLDQARAAELAAKYEQLDNAYDAQVRVLRAMVRRQQHLERCLRDIRDGADVDDLAMLDRIDAVLRGEYDDKRTSEY